MNTGARTSLLAPPSAVATGHGGGNSLRNGLLAEAAEKFAAKKKTRVYVAAESRLLQEALTRTLTTNANMEVVGLDEAQPFNMEALLQQNADVLLLASSGSMLEDIGLIRKVRMATPRMEVVLMGASGEELQFLQYVRGGIKGYLLRDASAEDVLEAVCAVQNGEAVCPGKLRTLLFRYFEREATSMPSATVHQQLGLTRREQQLIPLISKGLTNKEIANHFCLSEQTVKNHLYRMKHKVGADDRLGIVQVCRKQGFML